ncbi:MAG: Grx4 family monothiol glutaredoxin [Candidatus Omnitrophica bacterium]|nr:Grx4 family monothiol glutaredoxin [Candidatus Omnitrophota bacterium]
MTEDVISKIEADIKGNKVVIFMKGSPDSPMCGFSAASVQILKSFPYPFKGVDILANPEIRATLPQYSNWPTFPQIFIDGELVGGCDILHSMRDSGELETLLKKTFDSK